MIRNLLNAGAIDRLSITLDPVTVGGGSRLFDDTITNGATWTLADHTTAESGAICLLYDRRA